jgi:hypothetical protein
VSVPARAEAPASSFDIPSTAERIIGTVRRPRSTFETIVASPRWAGLLGLLFAVYFVLSAALYSTGVGRQALVDQWENTAIAFGQAVDDARYAEWQRLSEQAIPYAAALAFVTGPAAAVLLAAVLYGWFTGVRRGRASFQQVLAVVAHASVILMLQHVVAAPIGYARESTASPTTLVWFVGMVDQASPVARGLALVDGFVVWWLIVLAIGVAVLYRRRTRGVVTMFLGAYAALALLLTGVMAALGGVQ